MRYSRHVCHQATIDELIRTNDNQTHIINIGDIYREMAMKQIYQILRTRNKCQTIPHSIDQVETAGITDVFVPINISLQPENVQRAFLPSCFDPYFFGMAGGSDAICEDKRFYELFKRNEPIGCRDEKARETFRKHGIESYLVGCHTICFPKRTQVPANGKVFLVDVSEAFLKNIPDDIKRRCETLTHAQKVEVFPTTDSERKRLRRVAQDILTKYRDEAVLVCTGRLHAAVPCIAMGIPVIIAVDDVDSRFEWVDKYHKVYQLDEYQDIDWNPQPVDCEDIKIKFIQYIESLLRKKPDISIMQYLDDFYMHRNRHITHKKATLEIAQLVSNRDERKSFRYAIWGAGVHCDITYELVQKMISNACLVVITDKYKTGIRHGVSIIHGNDLDQFEIDHVFITTLPGKQEALEKLSSMFGREADKHYTIITSQQEC